MKTIKILMILCIALTLQSCFPFMWGEPEDEPIQQSVYKPITMQRNAFENSIALVSPATIKKSGKIYTYNHLLFVGEATDGFHVINNNNPSDPNIIKYLKAPGATDMAIKSNIIYINQATDLVAIKYDATQNTAEVVKRVKHVFPELMSPDGYSHYTNENEVIVGWIKQ